MVDGGGCGGAGGVAMDAVALKVDKDQEFVNPKINLNVCTQFVVECCYLKA